MEKKVRFHLHKVKKHWVTLIVSSVTLGLLLVGGSQAQAYEVATRDASTPIVGVVDTDTGSETSNSLEVVEQAEDHQTTSEMVDSSSDAVIGNQEIVVPDADFLAATSDEETFVVTEQVSPDTDATGESTTESSQSQPVTDQPVLANNKQGNESGVTPRNQFVSDDDGNWYYADNAGRLLTGAQTINTFNLYFYEDGVQAKDALVERDGKTYYYDADNGRLVTNQTFIFDGTSYTADSDGVVTKLPEYRNQFVSDDQGNWYYYGADGQKVAGFQTIDYVRLYFHEDGRQAKGELVTVAGKRYYFDKDSGELYRKFDPITIEDNTYTADSQGVLTEVPKYRNQFVLDDQGKWYYADDTGHWLTGAQTIDTFNLYFYEDGVQAKGALVERDGKTYYYDADNGRLVTNQTFTFGGKTYTADVDGVVTETPQYRKRFVSVDQGNWYYYDINGQKLTGFQTVDYVRLYFHEDGRQAKGELVTIEGKKYYFDQKTGELHRNVYSFEIDGVKYTADAEGVVTEVPKYRNQFVSDEVGNWYYYGTDGKKLTGRQMIGYHHHYFREDGVQVKDELVTIDGGRYYYNPGQGELLRNRFILYKDGNWYYLGSDGRAATGFQTIDGVQLYFKEDGAQVKGDFVERDGKQYYFEAENGRLATNQYLSADGKVYQADAEGVISEVSSTYSSQFVSDEQGNWYYYDADGKMVTGFQDINGQHLYFDKEGRQAKGGLFQIDGATYYFDKDSGEMAISQELEFQEKSRSSGGTVTVYRYFNADGKMAVGFQDRDGETYYYDRNGISVRDVIAYNTQIHGDFQSAGLFGLAPDYLFDEKTGAMKRNTFVWTSALKLHIPHYGRLREPGMFYCGPNGLAVTGWQEINGKTYYFYPESKFRVEYGIKTIDGKDYFFSHEGALFRNGIFTREKKFYTADEQGVLTKLETVKDQFVYDLNWKPVHYIDTDGKEQKGVSIKSDFVLYFKSDGSQAKGEFLTIEGNIYYFDKESGEMYRNRFASDSQGKQYYLSADGKALKDTVFEYDGKSYQADADGIVTEKG